MVLQHDQFIIKSNALCNLSLCTCVLILQFLMSKELCSCSACKNECPVAGGKFLHHTTLWRHRIKEQNLDIASSDIFLDTSSSSGLVPTTGIPIANSLKR